MKTLTENFTENLIIGVLLIAIAVALGFCLRDIAQHESIKPTERIERMKVSL